VGRVVPAWAAWAGSGRVSAEKGAGEATRANEGTADGERPDKQAMAEDRTDWAEDRTLLANERTFAGWMRTGLASCGIGLGFHAIFGKTEPLWLAKLCASLFIVIALLIFWAAFRAASRLHERLDGHAAEPVERGNLGLLASLFAVGAIVLGGVLWLL